MTGAAGVLQLVLEQGARGSQSPSRGEASVGHAVAELTGTQLGGFVRDSLDHR